MNTKTILGVAILALATISLASSEYLAKIKYSVKKIDAAWYVVNEQNKPLPIQANRSDNLEWTAEGSDMIFQFPEKLSVFFTKEDGSSAGDSYVVRVKSGKKLKLKVKGDAPLGTYVYSVFVVSDETYAEGSSPPVMIIK